jgi:L-ascorbate metabolism protein UlaG (beta-lactamase superfamily)
MNRRTFMLAGACAAPLSAAASPPAAASTGASTEGKESSAMKVQRLGWAGIKIEVGQTTVFVDARSDARAPLTAGTPNRYALVTHHHGDHFDPQALKTVFNDNSFVVCHREVAPWLNARGLYVQTADTYQPVFLSRGGGDAVAFAVPASDGFGHPQFSWVVDGGGRRIIHCGDTMWHGHWWDTGRAYGPFDVAFLPINGFRQVGGRYTDTGVPMSMTPEQAVAAAKVLGARAVCPVHYGEPDENYFEVADPEGTFVKAARQAGVKYRLAKANEWIELLREDN